MRSDLKIFRLNCSHTKKVAGLCALAFQDDPEAIHLICDPEERKRLLPHLFEFAVRYGILYGEGYAVSQQIEGIAIWLPSAAADLTPTRLIRAGFFPLCRKIGVKLVWRAMSFVRYAISVQRDNLTSDHWNLHLLAVSPAFQGNGYAGVLLRDMLERMDRKCLPCYLTTHNEKNIPIYRKYGFELVHSSPVYRTGVNLWAMLRTIPS